MGPLRFVIVLAGLLTACGLVVGPASGSCAFLIEYGLPHIEEGDTLHATVRECTASGERYKVVANSIAR